MQRHTQSRRPYVSSYAARRSERTLLRDATTQWHDFSAPAGAQVRAERPPAGRPHPRPCVLALAQRARAVASSRACVVSIGVWARLKREAGRFCGRREGGHKYSGGRTKRERARGVVGDSARARSSAGVIAQGNGVRGDGSDETSEPAERRARSEGPGAGNGQVVRAGH